jgi:hypothetical protein
MKAVNHHPFIAHAQPELLGHRRTKIIERVVGQQQPSSVLQ